VGRESVLLFKKSGIAFQAEGPAVWRTERSSSIYWQSDSRKGDV